MLRISMKKTAAAAAVTFAFVAGSLVQTSPIAPITSAQAQQAQLPDFTKLVEDNGKAVVSIQVTQKAAVRKNANPFKGMPKDKLDELRRFGFPFPFPGPDGFEGRMPERKGQGSGFIISPDGLILTNHHVVDGADEIKVHLTDDREFNAKVIGSDAKTDVAVIKIDGKDLPCVKLGNSKDVKVGEWVAAIGAPFGLENTVTSGIVSAKSRNLPSDQFVPFIQTDAAVNPGNSGGALVNDNGELVGINSLIESYSGSSSGVGFAIPVNYAKNIADQIIDGKTPVHPYLGATLSSVNALNARTNNLGTDSGAYVASVVEDGPAAKAGIQEGDVVTKLGDDEITSADGLIIALRSHEVGEKVEITLVRGKEEKKVTVELGSDEELQNQQQNDSATDTGNGGITDEQLRQYLEELLGQQGQGQGYGQGF